MTDIKLGNAKSTYRLGSSSGTIIFQSSSSPSVQSFTQLNSLIQSAGSGGTVDLNEGTFRILDETDYTSFSLNGISLPSNITIENGTIEGSYELTLTEEPSIPGVYSASLPFGIVYNDHRMYPKDPNAVAPIISQVFPKPPTDLDQYRFSKNVNMYSTDQSQAQVDGSGNITAAVLTGDGKAAFETLLNGNAVNGQYAVIRSGAANLLDGLPIESYDSGTGLLAFSVASYLDLNSSYLEIYFYGFEEDLEAGEWCIKHGTVNKIYYKPAYTPSTEVKILLPVVSHIFTNGVGLTLNNVTLRHTFNSKTGVDPGIMILHRAGSTDAPNVLTLSNCTLEDACYGIDAYLLDMQDCTAKRFVSRIGSLYDGSTILRNYLVDPETSEVFQFGTRVTGQVGDTTFIRETVMRDNFFRLPSSVHGQAISPYRGAWQNLIFEHNLMYNCQRPVRFSSNIGGAPEQPTSFTQCKFNNNLMFWDIDFGGATTGQKGISITEADSHLIGNEGHVEFFHNVNISLAAHGDITSNTREFDIRFNNLPIYFYGNIYGSLFSQYLNEAQVGISTEVVYAAKNMSFTPNRSGVRSFSQDDLLLNNQHIALGNSDYWNETTLQTGPLLSTAAADGGPIGIRWASIPTRSDLNQLDKTWALSYPASSYPDPIANGYITNTAVSINEGDKSLADRRPLS